MALVVHKYGVTISYKCCNYKYTTPLKKCPDRNSTKCMTCEYSRAELSGRDVTRLLKRQHD